MEVVIFKLCLRYGVNPNELINGSRKYPYPDIRKAIIGIVNRDFGVSIDQISKFFGVTDRTIKNNIKNSKHDEYIRREIAE